jgi:hypothetical protein
VILAEDVGQPLKLVGGLIILAHAELMPPLHAHVLDGNAQPLDL